MFVAGTRKIYLGGAFALAGTALYVLVQSNANRLERAGAGVLPSFARQDGFHDAGTLCGSGDGGLGAGFPNGAGSAFLSELPENGCDFFFRGLIHQAVSYTHLR